LLPPLLPGDRIRRLLVLALTGLLLTGMLPAGAVPTPLVAKNLELVTTIPDVGAISTAFSRSKPLMYVEFRTLRAARRTRPSSGRAPAV
jgi:hypothetical protein